MWAWAFEHPWMFTFLATGVIFWGGAALVTLAGAFAGGDHEDCDKKDDNVRPSDK